MADNPEVRLESAGDTDDIRRVHELAFQQNFEADLVDALRSADASTLSLVATYENEVVGHILFSPVTLETERGILAAVGLAPMAVVPARQNRGIGSLLVREGLARLAAAGHRSVVVLGHPDYYPRFGFRKASSFGIRWEHEAPDEAFMALELVPGALVGCSGIVRYRAEFSSIP